jgi:2-polyprenyl-3-methyl-5-hydroxy-6-metoxy-1,4-benzoquinol methylase
MANEPGHDRQRLGRATQEIRDYYRVAEQQPAKGSLGWSSRARLDHYEVMFRACGLLPLNERRLLDLGCANGVWLGHCCERWGARAENCVGADLRDTRFAEWRAAHPDLKITLITQPAHELDHPDASYDVIHHSMMLSSVPDPDLRLAIARNMWRMLKPGGFIVSFDFWINPINRNTVGIRHRELRRLFPSAALRFSRTTTVAPPLARIAVKIHPGLPVWLESLRILNTHTLVALQESP